MKNILLTICLLATSAVAMGAVVNITENTNPALDTTFLDTGYTHVDTTTNLEWLDFGTLVGNPATFGHSLNSAQLAYGPNNGDWRLATQSEVYALWDRFFPSVTGVTSFTDAGAGYDSTLVQSRNSWLFGFGTDAVVTNGTITSDTGVLYSAGMFANDLGGVDILGLKLDATSLTTTLYGPGFDGPPLNFDSAYTNLGVYMVRDYNAVPLPAAAWFMISGLLGLFVMARRKA